MTKEELHNHIKDVAEYYISKSWNSFLDLDTTDLILASIGVGKIIASEQEKRIAELEAQIEKMKCCGNCENRYGQEKCADCHNYSKWKFKQAEQFYEEIVE